MFYMGNGMDKLLGSTIDLASICAEQDDFRGVLVSDEAPVLAPSIALWNGKQASVFRASRRRGHRPLPAGMLRHERQARSTAKIAAAALLCVTAAPLSLKAYAQSGPAA